MRKTLAALCASFLLGTMISGCSMEKVGDLGNKNIRPNNVKYDANGNMLYDKRFADDQLNESNQINGRSLNNNNLVGSHKNYHMEMSEKVADSITRLGVVESSYVMLTDKNAYVAVVLNENDTNNARTMNRSNDGSNHLMGAEERLTNDIKDQIAAVVKHAKPDIENVYVSANPDFAGRLNNYMNDVKLGKPIQGFIAEFNAMVDRIFPAEAGDSTLNKTYSNNSGKLFE